MYQGHSDLFHQMEVEEERDWDQSSHRLGMESLEWLQMVSEE